MNYLCLHCSTILYHGECFTCLTNREIEMINLFDMIDSKLFPMTEERKSLILSIIDLELEEIRNKLNNIKKEKS